MSFDVFRMRMQSQGKTLRESRIIDAQDGLREAFEDDPSFVDDVTIVDRGKISARINNFRKEGFLSPRMDVQSSLDNEFLQGDLFYFNNNYWLCTMQQDYHGIYLRGEIVQCNNIIRFQTFDSYEIYEIPAVIERPYARRLSPDEVIQTSDKEYRVRMQLNDITRKIFLKKRIMLRYGYDPDGEFKPDVYSVDSRDSISNASIEEEKGFLILNLVEDQFNVETDNVEYMVADYREPPEPIVIVPSMSSIVPSSDMPDISMGAGIMKYYTSNLFDSNGKEVTDFEDIVFYWNVNANEKQLEFMKTHDNGRTFGIQVAMPLHERDLVHILNSQFELYVRARNTITSEEFLEDRLSIRILSLV